MKKNLELLIILIVIILAAFTIYTDTFQLTQPQADTLITFIPDFTLFIVTAYVFTSSRGLYRAAAFIMVGVAVAYFLGNAYTEGIISDTMLQDLTIAQYQTLVIAVGVFVGSLTYLGQR